MARDLIPPPSPAGRPGTSADAERQRSREREEASARQKGGLWHRSREAEATELDPAAALAAADPQLADAAPEQPMPREHAPSPYRSRFGLILGALIGISIAAGAIGAALYVASGGSDGAPDGWSSWKPSSDDGVDAGEQIAGHVAKKYRMKDDKQLVAVTAGPLEVSDVPLESVAMRTGAGGDIEYIKGDGLIYTLNGLGPKGSINVGTPTEERKLLLHREALELALYTFRYVKDVDLVVALLPPKPPDKVKAGAVAPEPQVQALFFRPGDLKPQLEIPLGATIPRATPIPESIPQGEARRIDALTRGNLFLANFQQTQDLKAYLVLDRLPR